MPDSPVTRTYRPETPLKYGCNPHQVPAAIYSLQGSRLPFKVLNGKPGYINLLDALNAWQLVLELRAALGLPAAASFKHVSPAGAAVAVPLEPPLAQVYETGERPLTPQGLAYLRARQADPMSSFGDFAAMSNVVDETTAELLRTEVSDGLIAPGYEPKALEILTRKKGGGYIVLQGDPTYAPPEMEYKEVFGVVFAQRRNDTRLNHAHLAHVVTRRKTLPAEAARDLLLGAITLKYTQSNSVGYALGGQMIGVGAGQQSRVDCTKLAGRKADVWYLRQHPKVLGLPFKAGTKRVERTNARVRYIEGDITAQEFREWITLFETEPAALTAQDKADWLAGMQGVSLASDAFFPFRDSIDHAAKRGVRYIIQPGGSVADQQIIEACDEYGMVMACSGVRLFHH
ncbi:MAG: phosphoribosylaminoimidazolecarboxamide formyltransferase [Candidatus Lambdaproteobacteria bacterium]|nr:phosphoribosylaminoimidazolecarboxamide formyltransferase [Candidatus Lambdaproteobacteria bacterium]